MDTDILDGVSAGEVKGVLEKIAAGAIANFEVIIKPCTSYNIH